MLRPLKKRKLNWFKVLYYFTKIHSRIYLQKNSQAWPFLKYLWVSLQIVIRFISIYQGYTIYVVLFHETNQIMSTNYFIISIYRIIYMIRKYFLKRFWNQISWEISGGNELSKGTKKNIIWFKIGCTNKENEKT